MFRPSLQAASASTRLVESGQQPQQHNEAHRQAEQPEQNQSHNSPFHRTEKEREPLTQLLRPNDCILRGGSCSD
jgi:hypothetical protein